MAADTLASSLPVAELYSSDYCEYYGLLPLEIAEGRLRVAVAGDPNQEAIADLADTYGAPIELVPIEPDQLSEAIKRTFAEADSVVELAHDLAADLAPDSPAEESLADARDLANQPPVIKFVNLLIRDAFEAGASDIHLESSESGLRVRLRIDGVLSELAAPPQGLQAAIVSRLKLLAELDIAERRTPQDGRIRARLESRDLDLRVSTAPTMYGESVVLRLLDRGGAPVTLDALGMAPQALTAFRRLAGRAHGILLATGPTGSGKTTTLYAALGLRHPSEEKIITVEDPIEYRLPGVTQVPVHSKTGVTFGTALRSILRQDPDVLMVGEMRDRETAAIAIQAAMTGHLVFSSLHTNDAVTALTRLLDLGVESYLLAGTIEGVLAQRLVRRICPDCRAPYQPEPGAVQILTEGRPLPTRGHPFERGTGCAACRQTGFRGRTGIFELLSMTDDLRHAVSRAPVPAALRALAREQGMVTLKEDGWSKVRAGITTVEEVLRVAGD
ncbi:MAG TPA: GspE/PulE family protein [Gemmatimonadales bacterium]|jgi:general secretion pathway protein E|nr:GspE/PulE family protein [Gemmatimonadales bacterium]